MRPATIDPKQAAIQSSVVSTGLIAGKPAHRMDCPRKSSAFRHALYLWEPRLPAMGREAAPVTDVRHGQAVQPLVHHAQLGIIHQCFGQRTQVVRSPDQLWFIVHQAFDGQVPHIAHQL
ncbi:hypothetical protein D3C81_1062810 [compost metagenome]